MKPTDLLALLQACYQERSALLLRHVAVARHVGNLDANNTYQYLVAREETHLSWLQAAIDELGGVAAPAGAEPTISASKAKDFVASLIREDADSAAAFVTKWQPRVAEVTNARHRGMLQVILGETLEHRRFFEQALAGREDLLGRRTDAGARRGEVVGSRWIGD